MAVHDHNLGSVGRTFFSQNNAYAATLQSGSAAAYHNQFRGKCLGTTMTAEQSAAIQAGTFEDIYCGDYWENNSVKYRIAECDPLYRCGDSEIGHHVLCVPDSVLLNAVMNSSNTTTGGYKGCAMRGSGGGLSQAKTIIQGVFSSHLMTYRDIITNAVSNGQASGWGWEDACVELLPESAVYGSPSWGNNPYEMGIFNKQLALFAQAPQMIHIRAGWWLRSVASGASFADVSSHGYAANFSASNSLGVRPLFLLS